MYTPQYLDMKLCSWGGGGGGGLYRESHAFDVNFLIPCPSESIVNPSYTHLFNPIYILVNINPNGLESFDIIYFYDSRGGHPIDQVKMFSNVPGGKLMIGIRFQDSR